MRQAASVAATAQQFEGAKQASPVCQKRFENAVNCIACDTGITQDAGVVASM